jgi:ubiquinone/menaquinone biosynthesis C-methylase UbiE
LSKSIYDAVASKYDSSTLRTPYFTHLQRRYREVLRENLHRLYVQPILDLGCGTGQFASIVLQASTHYVGVDISQEMLHQTRLKTKTSANAAGADLVRANAASLPFNTGAFGAVVSIGMVSAHLPSYEQGLSEVSRVIRGDGGFILEVDNKWSVDLVHYLADAATRGKIFSYGFSNRAQILNYILRDEYAWQASLDGLPTKQRLILHKISLRRLRQLMKQAGLRVESYHGIHIATLFVPKEFPGRPGWSSAYLRLVEGVDRRLGRVKPFVYWGGSLIVIGKRDAKFSVF